MLLDVLLCEAAVLQQLIHVDVKLGLVRLDALVHQRLSEGRLVGLVVAVFPIADKVDDNIALELSTPIGCQLADVVDSLYIVSIDVEYWSVDCLGDISAVSSRTSEPRVSCEPNLVVDNQVDCATSRVCR